MFQTKIFTNKSFINIIIHLFIEKNDEKIEKICRNISSKSFIVLINEVYRMNPTVIVENSLMIRQVMKNVYYDSFMDDLLNYIDNEVHSIVYDILNKYQFDYENYYDNICDETVIMIKELSSRKTQEMSLTFNYNALNYYLSNNDVDNVIKKLNVSKNVDRIIDYYMDPTEPDYDYDDEHHYMSYDSEENIIDDMFR